MTSDPSKYHSALVQKLTGNRDLRKILETTVKDLGDIFNAETCQVMLSNPLDPNVTAICEHRASKDEPLSILPSVTLPLVLHGRTLGSVSLARYNEINSDEVNVMRLILGELSDIIRHAQINDIVQRDTFRETFLVEITNFMSYSLGIGDALFMVVNILGKALAASRCLFICTDDTQAGWKCYEFWQQEKIQSCQDYRWPTTDSAVIAQTLLSQTPLHVYEGQANSYVSPVQEELQFIGVKSLLGVALRTEGATHGCVILQQCDYRRAWTRKEIDMVQSVADKVAEALLKLPAEKRAREPIMQLHQRIVTHPEEEGKAPSNITVRNALKGALGQQAIPSARKTSQPPQPKVAAPPPAPPTPPAPKPAAAASAAAVSSTVQAKPVPPPAQRDFAPPAATTGGPVITPVQSKSVTQSQEIALNRDAASTNSSNAGGAKSLGSILGASSSKAPSAPGLDLGLPGSPPNTAEPALAAEREGNKDPYADLDFGDYTDFSDGGSSHTLGRPPKPTRTAAERANDPDSTWGNLDAMGSAPPGQSLQPVQPPMGTLAATSASPAPTPTGFETIPPGKVATQVPLAAASAAPAAAAAAAPEPESVSGDTAPGASKWGDLDAIGTPASEAPVAKGGQWGNLDSIPTPAGAATAGGGGLSGLMVGKARASASSGLLGKKGKGKGAPEPKPSAAPPPPPVEIDEKVAEAKLKEMMKSTSNDTSDYIFATPGVDPRLAGRIDGWVTEIEKKDKYSNGHAKAVAEYAVAIAKEAGLSSKEVDAVRLASLLHDVGKLGCSQQILQKRDEELTDPELILMMKHPLDGAELLESFPDLKPLAPIVRAHHEEFDGNGYPAGLKGDEIPVAARIIAVANSYHSLTSPMVFGEGLNGDQARDAMLKGAGKQWDPNFVQALLRAITANKVSTAL